MTAHARRPWLSAASRGITQTGVIETGLVRALSAAACLLAVLGE